MKMRKKLAALLAAAMIASVMPMTAFAASENRVTKVVKVAEDTALDTAVGSSGIPALRVKLKDGLSTGDVFYLTLDGAHWGQSPTDTTPVQQAAIRTGLIKAEKKPATTIRENDTSADITWDFDGDDLIIESNTKIAIDEVLVFTLDVFVTDEEATIEIDGHNSPVDSGKYVFAKSSSDYSVDLIVDDADVFADQGDVADITIKEPYIGAFYNGALKDGKLPSGGTVGQDEELSFTLELRDNDFTFETKQGKTLNLKAKKGFRVNGNVVINSNKDMVTVTLPKASDLDFSSIGEFEIENLQVKAKRKATKGEVKVTARNVDGKVLNGSQTFTAAEYSDYTTTLKMKKDYEVLAGQEVEVEFTLADKVSGSLLNNRRVEFNLPKGVKFKSAADSIEARSRNKDADGQTSWSSSNIDLDDTSNKYDSFEFEFTRDMDEEAEYEFRATLLVSNSFDKDEIILTAEGNALSEAHEIVAAKVIKPVEVEVTPMDVKVGLRKQTGGKIVIKENAKEAILKNYTDEAQPKHSVKDADIEIRIDADDADGLKITDAEIKVTEGDLLLDLDAKTFVDGIIRIPVKRQSTKPSTIEITDVEVTANRNVPEGKFDIKVGGAALSKNTLLDEFINDKAYKEDLHDGNDYGYGTIREPFMDPVVVSEFINITTKNVEDFTGVTAAKVGFVLGSNQYLVNGVAKEMDAAPFVKDGRTMVPVRYVAQALGVTEDKVVWDQATQTVTVLADKVIQVKLGSKTMVINGANVPMTAAAELVDNRTFVPIAELARALGVSVEWDETSKTATFN